MLTCLPQEVLWFAFHSVGSAGFQALTLKCNNGNFKHEAAKVWLFEHYTERHLHLRMKEIPTY